MRLQQGVSPDRALSLYQQDLNAEKTNAVGIDLSSSVEISSRGRSLQRGVDHCRAPSVGRWSERSGGHWWWITSSRPLPAVTSSDDHGIISSALSTPVSGKTDRFHFKIKRQALVQAATNRDFASKHRQQQQQQQCTLAH